MSECLIRNPVISRAESEELIRSVRWFHKVEILPGLFSPGIVYQEPAKLIDGLQLGDLTGKKILEIATWDGPTAFELKARGADVTAADIQNPDNTGFGVLRRISGLEIPYVRCSVYELSQHFKAEFDIIFFYGVFYHLKHPLLSFEEIAKCLKPGGFLFTEGAGLCPRIEDVDGNLLEVNESVIEMLDHLDDLKIPLALSYPGTYLAGENWFLPNRSALQGWLVSAGLEPDPIYVQSSGDMRRLGTRAVKVRESSHIEHSLIGEDGHYESSKAGIVIFDSPP